MVDVIPLGLHAFGPGRESIHMEIGTIEAEEEDNQNIHLSPQAAANGFELGGGHGNRLSMRRTTPSDAISYPPSRYGGLMTVSDRFIRR